jgi:hypothetical protein
MNDKPIKTIETDEYIYEEYAETVATDGHPNSNMNTWIRSLFHLQAHPNAPTTPPPNCTRQACYEAGQINSCECNYCLPTQQEESE